MLRTNVNQAFCAAYAHLFFVISGEGEAKEVRFINTSQPAVIRGTAREL